VKINTVPISAGNKRLIIHITKVAENMFAELKDSKPKRKIAAEPLTPISVMAIVGIIETTKSIIMIKTIASA
jgi:hypothetical protein